MMPMDLPLYSSPKRNREPSESDCYSPSPSPTSSISNSSFQEARFSEEAEPECQSPQATVAGRFGELRIRGDYLMDTGLVSHNIQSGPAPSSISGSHVSESYSESKNIPGSWPASGRSHETQDRLPQELFPQHGTNDDLQSSATFQPKSKSIIYPRDCSEPSSPSKSRKQRLLSPSGKRMPEDPFTWHDHEITGHNPKDPNDDGYGINGVGFKPTAAIAWARAQKRQKQVAEWKTREAREARERRRERRNDGLERHRIDGITKSPIQKRVKFDF
ncbi:hypothetical protein N7495_008529 [Penicillium taxi]|uniref:uncharacterized protein n=1 Tax=Penicillium taxi TaxID=168475 RepID=UPI00254599AC|nr:uncharacterized protein N7495_008529 [Penicillium taxi]KAJ5888488.1 hypothetical protein N7495_008529 [Penicillium taxi]